MPDCDNRYEGPVDDDELVLYYYDELPAARRLAVRTALLEPALQARYDTLCRDLQAVAAGFDTDVAAQVPGDIGERIWQRVDPGAGDGTAPRKAPGAGRASGGDAAQQAAWLALAASILVTVIGISYDAGQRSMLRSAPPALAQNQGPAEGTAQQAAATPDRVQRADASERVLMAAVRRHLGASERLLVDFANSPTFVTDPADMSEEALAAERQWARTLLTANRLYRFAAQRAGQSRLSDLLGDLEPVLIELANGNPGRSPRYNNALRESIASRELLPRVRAGQSLDGLDASTMGSLQEKEETT